MALVGARSVADLSRDDVDLYIFHQATDKMLTELRKGLKLDEEQMPIVLRDYGNTVSSTIPIVIDQLRADGRLKPGMKSMLVGFGVGWSWAGCVWQDLYQPK